MQNPKTSLTLHLFSGFHDSSLDVQFQSTLWQAWLQSQAHIPLILVGHPIHSGCRDLKIAIADQSILIGFSAGVIRAALCAAIAQSHGCKLRGLIAMDGWGVPLATCRLPTYRLSHDCLTHSTSTVLGGAGIFFADPPVDHLTLWTAPDQVSGWYFTRDNDAFKTSAIHALVQTLVTLADGGLNQLD